MAHQCLGITKMGRQCCKFMKKPRLILQNPLHHNSIIESKRCLKGHWQCVNRCHT